MLVRLTGTFCQHCSQAVLTLWPFMSQSQASPHSLCLLGLSNESSVRVSPHYHVVFWVGPLSLRPPTGPRELARL